MTRILMIAMAVLITACGGNKGGDKKSELAELKKQEAEITKKIKAIEAELGVKSNTADKVKLVRTEDVQPKSFIHYIDIQGRIDASENVIVNVRNQGGMISRIFVKEGQAVKAGQLLAETDASAYFANVEALKVQLQTAATVFEKQKKLWDQKIGTEIQFITSKSQKESLEKNIAALQEQIEMTKITAPISGVVDEVMVKIGQMASPSIPNNGIRIVNMNSLKVKADIAESYAKNVRTGNDVIINFPDIDKEINSNITYVGKNINQLTRTFGVEASLGNQEDYHPNMIAVLKIADYKAENVLVIPINILQNSEDGQFVFIAAEKGGKLVATKRVVAVGKASGNYVEVVSGLTQGEKIITIGYQDLNEGDEVKI